ncbi:MAG: Gfo/Idh/MocA family oxidoreductase [Magnetococcus sp. YQC-3]
MTKQRIGLIGVGHWGPNIATSFEATGRASMAWLCDLDASKEAKLATRFPDARFTTDLQVVLADPSVVAVAISTPVSTHFQVATQALSAGKHVLLEKPLTATSEQAVQLIAHAEACGKILMVGHIFEYNATIETLKGLIDSGELGEIHYMYMERTNLGPVRTDVNALWDLATHDISIIHYLIGSFPTSVSARGQAFLNGQTEDVAFVTFAYEHGLMAHIHASWLNPRKVRQITVVGSKKMATWDDMDMQAPIRIFDKRVRESSGAIDADGYFSYKTAVFDGGVYIPRAVLNQPLKAECEHFLHCMASGDAPRTDGWNGLAVVRALEAATLSMQNGGASMPIVHSTR